MSGWDVGVVMVFAGQLVGLGLLVAAARPLTARGKRSVAGARRRAEQVSATASALGDSARRLVEHGKSIEAHGRHAIESARLEEPDGFLITPRGIRNAWRLVGTFRRRFADDALKQGAKPGGRWRILERVGLIPPLVSRFLPALGTGLKIAGVARSVAAARRNP